jgi:acyl CoA:acetate/3-ketoacid CoA transferase beta subunit
VAGVLDSARMRAFIAMELKILTRCTLPFTGLKVVNLIITELAVIEVTPRGLVLKEIAAGTTVEQVRAATGADLIVDGPPAIF